MASAIRAPSAPQTFRNRNQLRALIENFGIHLPSLTYEAMEEATLSFLRSAPQAESSALRLLRRLQRQESPSRSIASLQLAIHRFLPSIVPEDRRRGFLRRAALAADDLGRKDVARQLYRVYLGHGQQPSSQDTDPYDLPQTPTQGYDPEIRDRYGALLEAEEDWQGILDLEADFLSRSYFCDWPENRIGYERSFQRVRRAYARLGIPVPTHLKESPEQEMATALRLLADGKHKEARRLFRELVESDGYKALTDADAVSLLASYARSIRLSLRLTVEDWQEVTRCLSILVRDYADAEGFDPQHHRDLAAARRQVEKLGGSISNA